MGAADEDDTDAVEDFNCIGRSDDAGGVTVPESTGVMDKKAVGAMGVGSIIIKYSSELLSLKERGSSLSSAAVAVGLVVVDKSPF